MATEKRLIDANALIKDWNELTKRMVRGADGKIPVDFGLVICELSKTPTVDAVEVVHGRWLSSEEYANKLCVDLEDGWAYCSECEQPMRDFYGWAYCPNCGAKMDGDGDA